VLVFAGEDEIFTARRSKRNLHYSMPLWDFALFENGQARSMSEMAIMRWSAAELAEANRSDDWAWQKPNGGSSCKLSPSVSI
jgi:hypothetical protein